MDSTGAAEFRAKMKEWFDAAEAGPVKIDRPAGKKAVILIGQEQFEAMISELQEYRNVVKGLKVIAEGKTTTFSRDAFELAIEEGKSKHKSQKSKKAVS
jgi:PHD/YefM family antitoxin component YafN of YafNO toxin-antitoxin module